MDHIYLVWTGHRCGADTLHGVYSTLDKAQQHADAINARRHPSAFGAEVEECRVDAPIVEDERIWPIPFTPRQ